VLSDVLMPVYIVGGLGLVFGVCLAYASKKFVVKIDERIAAARELLPGANCGACGQTGCDGFADSLIAGKSAINGCPVGGVELSKKLGKLMGIEASDDSDKKIARIMCEGSFDNCRNKYEYAGINDCTTAAVLHGGPSACSYGCLGMGNCVRACQFGAIEVENGLARVIDGLCVGCSICVSSCPKKIIKMIPAKSEYTVQCSSLDKGSVVKKSCSVGCIGCGRCFKVCPSNAIKLYGTLAEINPLLCTSCGECEKACPVKIIKHYNTNFSCH